jgi:hypothetical protein
MHACTMAPLTKQGGARGEGEGGSGASPVLTAEDLYRRAGWLTPDSKQPAQQQQV